MEIITFPELGILNLALLPERSTSFSVNPARLLYSAILKRIELIDPALSKNLHDSIIGAHSTEHPITVSSLLSTSTSEDCSQITAGKIYKVRITSLTAEVSRILDLSFNPMHPLGKAPLFIGEVRFQVVHKDTHWIGLTTYASILTRSNPSLQICLEFVSPTKFRTQIHSSAIPEPSLCLHGYLRKWNAFSSIQLDSAALLDFVKNNFTVSMLSVKSAKQHYRNYYEYAFTGNVRWQSASHERSLLRQVNALVDFAVYCGTGIKTSLGMGQTLRR